MTKRIKLILLIIIGSISTACAQQQYYDWRLGAGVGGSYYLGDLSYGLNRNAFAAPAWQVMLGRTISPSFGLELNGTWATLAGNDRTMGLRGNLLTNNPNLERGFSFQTTVRSASLQLHYRFNNGVLLSRYARFAPYIFAGAGIADFRVNNGPETGADFPAQVATIPAGAGLQVRLADRLSANVRDEARYEFTDYLDNVSTGSNRNDMYFLWTESLQYHFNWGKRKPFKSHTLYVGYEQPSIAMARQTQARHSPARPAAIRPGRTGTISAAFRPAGRERFPAYSLHPAFRLRIGCPASPIPTAPPRATPAPIQGSREIPCCKAKTTNHSLTSGGHPLPVIRLIPITLTPATSLTWVTSSIQPGDRTSGWTTSETNCAGGRKRTTRQSEGQKRNWSVCVRRSGNPRGHAQTPSPTTVRKLN